MKPQTSGFSLIHIDPRASAALRTKIESAIQKLVDALDAFDTPGEDLEEIGDDEPDQDGEPSLGSRAGINQAKTWADRHSMEVDFEAEHDGREPDEDTEAEEFV